MDGTGPLMWGIFLRCQELCSPVRASHSQVYFAKDHLMAVWGHKSLTCQSNLLPVPTSRCSSAEMTPVSILSVTMSEWLQCRCQGRTIPLLPAFGSCWGTSNILTLQWHSQMNVLLHHFQRKHPRPRPGKVLRRQQAVPENPAAFIHPHGTASFHQNPQGLRIYEQNTRAARSSSPLWVPEFAGQCLLSRRAVKQFLESKHRFTVSISSSSRLWLCFHQTSCSEQNPQLLSARIKSKTVFKTEPVCVFHQLASKEKSRLRDVKNTPRNRFDDDNIQWIKQK